MTPDALKAGDKAGDTLLEKLQAALMSLGKHPYEFADWAQCTCGHIYRAATGRGTARSEKVLDCRTDSFTEMLEVVAEANNLAPVHLGQSALSRVSSGTMDVADRLYPESTYDGHSERQMRQAAIHMIETAIEFEHGRNERARLALVGA